MKPGTNQSGLSFPDVFRDDRSVMFLFRISSCGPHTGRTDAEKEAFREERLAGMSDGQTMLCVAGDFNAHICVVEPGAEESIGKCG